MDKSRNSNLELLRIIAMALIVLFHYGIHGNSEQIFSADFSLNQTFTYFFCSWGLVGVYCFFYISFWFLQNSNKVSVAKIAKLYFTVVLIDMIVCFINMAGGYEISVGRVVRCLLAPINSTYWFVTVYLIIYVLNPWLMILIKHLSDKGIVILTAFYVCFSTLFKMTSSVLYR